MAKRPVMLMILDGWGIAPAGKFNAVAQANTPNLDSIFAKYPYTQLEASGSAVGLPDGQMGNSEVGHLNIGAGRIIYQELTRITKAVQDGDLFVNPVLCEAMEKAKADDKALHLMGLLSDGGVHSHIDHLLALMKMAKIKGLDKVYIHAFLDGRDVGPKTAVSFIEKLKEAIQNIGIGQIATVSGRYYAMDRDKRWERIKKAYDILVYGKGNIAKDAVSGIETAYAEGETDEFVKPFVIENVDGQITAGDSIIFFNFRPDRARQLTRALSETEFDEFERSKNAMPVNFVCMTQYDATIAAPVAFPPQNYDDTLGEVLAKQGLKQLRIAETEKYAHVTFFFNGGVEIPNSNEERILIPSPAVATYDLQPEMSANEVTDALLTELDKDKFDVIILNFANPDMVGHTGVMQAAVKAMETVDTCVGKIVDKILQLDGSICITADHGNLEKMADEVTLEPYTAHTTNKVPFIVVSNNTYKLQNGILADIAPTLLDLLHIEKPKLMTGTSLIKK